MQKLLTFFSKNTCELDIVLTRTVNILTTNELIKLTALNNWVLVVRIWNNNKVNINHKG